MELFFTILNGLKSPKTSLIVLTFCSLCLLTPFSRLGISPPEFVQNYRPIITTLLLVAVSVVSIEAFYIVARFLLCVKRKVRRRSQIPKIIKSLNLDERCVIFHIVASGLKALKADQGKPEMISLRQKGALYMASGVHSLMEWPHVLPDDIADFVRRNAETFFPREFINSPRFQDEVRERVNRAINWRDW